MDRDTTLKLASEIVVAYLARNTIDRSEVAQLITEVRGALEGPIFGAGLIEAQGRAPRADALKADPDLPAADGGPTENAAGRSEAPQNAAPRNRPAVPIDQSINDEYLINLEDGKRYRTLKRHLMAKHGMTPDEYRSKWGLPDDYPMVAPSYARERSEVAKRSGLGRPVPVSKSARKRGLS
jgi:predicted transcriptional regulator